MRELTTKEMQMVNGGFGPMSAALGFITYGVGAYISGGNGGQIVGAALVGGVSGFFGGIAGATRGFARVTFATYSVGLGGVASYMGVIPQSK